MMSKESIKETLVNFVVPLVALVAILIMVFVIIIPTIKGKPAKEAEIAKAQALNKQLGTKLESLNKMKNLENVVGDYSRLVSRVLVDEPMVPELLTQVDNIAKESGLEVTKLTYSFTDADKAAAAKSSYPYVNVSLGVEGSYDQLISFFESLEDAARVVYVQNFRFSKENNDTAGKLAIQVTLASPYLEVNSKPNTDEPVKIDISDKEFIALVSELKKLKYYEPRVDEAVQERATEETAEEANDNLEEPVAPVVPETPQAPVTQPAE